MSAGERPRAGRSGISVGIKRSNCTFLRSRNPPLAGNEGVFVGLLDLLVDADGPSRIPYDFEVLSCDSFEFTGGNGAKDSTRSFFCSLTEPVSFESRLGWTCLLSRGCSILKSGTCRTTPFAKAAMEGLLLSRVYDSLVFVEKESDRRMEVEARDSMLSTC